MQQKWVDGQPTAKIAETFIASNDRLTSFERLEIYNKQYWYRLRDCFGDDFPGLRAVLGDKKFDGLAAAYLENNPSRSFTLRNLGQFLIPFLEKNPGLTVPYTSLAVDMAKFEWAQVQAFDGPGFAPLTAADVATLATKPTKVRLHVQPYVQLIELRFPLDDFLLALKKKNSAMRSEASNAIDETVERKKIISIRRPRPKQIFLAVHRYQNSLYYKRLSQESFTALSALQQNQTLESALTVAIAQSKKPNQNWPKLVQEWFDIWTQLGWFYSPKTKAAGTATARKR